MARDLLFSVTGDDLRIEYFSGKGAGGQHRNRHQNCIRMFHDESGASVTAQRHKERTANIREAFHAITRHPDFRLWMAKRVDEEITGKTVDEIVDEMMSPENLTVEIKENGQWTRKQDK